MSRLSLVETRDAVIAKMATIEGVSNVRKFPLGLAMKADLDKVIFEKLPDLQLPAILVVLADFEDTGRRKEIYTSFALIVVSRDDDGGADSQTLPILDAIRAMEGTQLQAEKLWLHIEADGTVLECDPIYSIAGLEIKTREYGA